MDHRETVTVVARSLGLLDTSGRLLTLDSLMVLDFSIALEEKIGVEIPVTSLTQEIFRTIDSIAQMLTELVENATGRA